LQLLFWASKFYQTLLPISGATADYGSDSLNTRIGKTAFGLIKIGNKKSSEGKSKETKNEK